MPASSSVVDGSETAGFWGGERDKRAATSVPVSEKQALTVRVAHRTG